MKKIVLSILLILSAGILLSNGDEEDIIYTKEASSGPPLQIIVIAGPGWSHTFKLRVVTFQATPQIVVWVETPAGEYIDTLFITRRFGKQVWKMAPDQEDDQTFRIETIPYWMYKLRDAGIRPPTADSPVSDSITGATPDWSFIIDSVIETGLNEVSIFLEVNLPFDGNDNFPNDEAPDSEKYNAASGQPAIVYKAVVKLNEPGIYVMLPVGYSSPSGIDGSLTEDMSVITTALSIIAGIKVVVE